MDPKRELLELASAVRAYVEWHEGTGSEGLLIANDGALAALDPAAPAARRRPPGATPSNPGASAPSPATPVNRPTPVTATPVPSGGPPAPGAPLTDVPTEERLARLTVLGAEARACTRCRLHEQRKQAVFSRGSPLAELCFVGEGPGADEDAQGEPFVGKAGQLLDKMIAAMGYGRDDVYVCNIVKCRPPDNRKPEPDEMAACSSFIKEQLELVSPKVIVALGATAVQGLFGTSQGITRMRGSWKLYRGRIPVMPTFHPAYLLRQPNAKREVWSDLQEVMKALGKARRPS